MPRSGRAEVDPGKVICVCETVDVKLSAASDAQEIMRIQRKRKNTAGGSDLEIQLPLEWTLEG